MPYQSKVSCMSHKQSTEHSINHAECGMCYLAQFSCSSYTQLTHGLAPHTIIHKYFAKSTKDALLRNHTLPPLLPWASECK